VLFDLGSTLIYYDGEWPEIAARAHLEMLSALQQAGLQLDGPSFVDEYQKRLHEYYIEREAEFVEHTTAYILKTLLDELGHSRLPEEELRRALRAWYAVSQEHWQVEAETIPTLQKLKQQGYRLAIISNAGDDEDVQTLIDNAGIRPYFDVIVSSAALGIRKPNPLIFTSVLERLGVAPQRAVMVGDRLGADILGAHNAGLPGILITRRADTSANLVHRDTIIPDAVIASLDELFEVLPRLGA
jgi:putative hydrolase of the HAD superfamily